MRTLLQIYFILCFTLTLSAQSVWTGAIDTDWTNPGNWAGGVPQSGFTVTIPGTPAGGNFPVYAGSPVIDYTIQNGGTLTFNSLVYNNGTIINFSGGNIVSTGTFINSGAMTFDNDGIFDNEGTFENYGVFDNANAAELNNHTDAVFNNFSSINSNGTLQNDGTLNNYGNIRSTQIFNNNGNLHVYGTVDLPNGSTYTNPASALLHVENGGVFDINTNFPNDGEIINDGKLILATTSTLDHTGILTNNGSMETAGLIRNNGNFTNNGDLLINDSGRLENNSLLSNNGSIELSICGILVQNDGTTITGIVESDGIIYELLGQVEVTGGEFGREFMDLSDRKPPVAGCKPGVTARLDANGEVMLDVSDVDKGGYGECGAQIVNRSITPNTFTTADIGDVVVTLTLEDEFGFISSCDAVVSILPYLPPLIPVDDPAIDFNCPSDITVTGPPGSLNAEASWTEPEATTDCTVPGGGDLDCNAIAETINGYDYIGELNGSKFFLSQASMSWGSSKDAIHQLNLGGFLATVDSQDENDFIQAALNSHESAWIGFTDEHNEGTFVWDNGDPVNYTNWRSGEPSGRSGEDYARLRGDDGTWTDRENTLNYKHILEIPCPVVIPQPDCNTLPNSISGFHLIGDYNDSRYYVSDGTEDWSTAQGICASNGGQLVTITSIEENDFIIDNINPSSGSVWIGLNTVGNPGVFSWADGDPSAYRNWQQGEPNGNGVDYGVRLKKDNGKWTDRPIDNYHYNFVLEIPCPVGGGGNCQPSGTISREVWTHISGVEVADIPLNQPADISDERTSFEAPTNVRDQYGTRMRGYIFPPETGEYRFWIASDDNGELYLSTDDDPANKQLIASVGSWTRSREWNKFSSQRSAQITLQAGQRYYIEALAKEQYGGDNLAVGWKLPDGSLNRPISGNYLAPWDGGASCSGGGDPELTVRQIRGGSNGGFFPEGVNEIFYQVSDACDNEELCSFELTVETVPATFSIDECPADIIVNTAPGAPDAVVTWDDPVASSNCFRGQVANVVQTLGTDKGEAFKVGTETVVYAVFDSCGNFDQCAFNVTVIGVPAMLSLDNCPTDLEIPADPTTQTAIVTWAVPTASSDCYRGNVNIAQIAGPQNGSELAIGEYPVSYLISDGCNNTQICFFTITVIESCFPAGTPCDDGDSSTFDDVEDGNCNCAGTPCPTAGTACDDGDPSTFNDEEDGNCNCAGTPCPTAGTACDDGDPSTFNDEEDGNCNCVGTPCPTAGTACDDGDPSTFNDEEDGNCNCAGTPCPTAGTACDDGDPSTFNDEEDGNCNCTGTPCPTAGTACDDGDPSTFNDEEDGNCNCAGTPCPMAGTACDDGDPSTFNDVEDGNCNCAGTPCPSAGTSCDDGDPSTFNDIEDGNCNCAGTPCPTAGTACDDGDPLTENDVEDGNCNCAGTPIDTGCTTTENLALHKPAQQSGTQQNATPDRANDGNTDGNFWASSSVSLTNWVHNPYWEVDLETVSNIETINIWNRTDVQMEFLANYYVIVSDVPFVSTDLTATLNQAGVEAYFETDVAGTPSAIAINRSGRYVRIQLAGTSFLALAEVEVIGCAGTPAPPSCMDGIQNGDETGIDCGGTDCPACCPEAGTACDDGDPDTENDVEDGNCNCAGTPIGNGPCASTENLALFGTATQSGTQQGGEASRANDGNTDGNYWATQSVSLTNWVPNAWWEIDLGEITEIETINVWNRTDVQMDFLRDYYILVSDEPFVSDTLNMVLNQSGVDAYLQSDQAGTPTSVDINRSGRYVRIQLRGVSFLALAEVEVLGCTQGGGRNQQRDLLEFTANKRARSVSLDWLSNTDHKDDQLIVEKSLNGRDFEVLARLEPRTEGTNLSIYRVLDQAPKRGYNWYRLRQMRKDGRTVVSPVRRVFYELDVKAFNLYPNPAIEEVFINLTDFQGQATDIVLYNKLGQPLAKRHFEQLDRDLVRFDVSNLQAGVYTVSVKVEGLRRMTAKFVVVRL